MQIDATFREKIKYLDLESIKASPDTIYIIDQELKLRAFNPAWTRFASNNDGLAVLSRYRLGDRIDQSFPSDLKTYYVTAYLNAISSKKVFEQDYECSSAAQFRLFHQTAYPLEGGHGVLISNHLVKEYAYPDQAYDFHLKFVDAQGIITQCCHCRKLKDPSKDQVWIWVPSKIENPAQSISHAICPRCLDFYYPDVT